MMGIGKGTEVWDGKGQWQGTEERGSLTVREKTKTHARLEGGLFHTGWRLGLQR